MELTKSEKVATGKNIVCLILFQVENGVSFMAQKSGITFDFLNLDNSDTLTLKTLMTFPVDLIQKGHVDLGMRLAVTYKSYFERICQAAGQRERATSIGRNDWIRGALLVHKTHWYVEVFMPTVVDVYFRSLGVDNDQGVTFTEWKRLYSQRGITDDEFCESTFKRMDKNGDGRISKSEFEYAFSQYGLSEDPEVDFSFLYAKK